MKGEFFEYTQAAKNTNVAIIFVYAVFYAILFIYVLRKMYFF